MIDEDLAAVYKPGMTAGELYLEYFDRGRSPSMGFEDETNRFSPWDYAKERSFALCGEEPPQRPSIADWFKVAFDAASITIDVRPGGRDSRHETVRWEQIIRICLKTDSFLASDEIYIFTADRPESYLIPVDAGGGGELWNEIIARKLFDAELAIKAASTTDSLFCDPPQGQNRER